MVNNRRNFYRILHVQPEAPLEIIKASYRSLMTKLNAHPDRGGDPATAALINQAYAVLSDPEKRQKYDSMLFSRLGMKANARAAATVSTKYPPQRKPQVKEWRWEGVKTASTGTRDRCLFCSTETANVSNGRCLHCHTPLALIKKPAGSASDKHFGRRKAPRIRKAGTIWLYPTWPHQGYAGELQDLSISGLSLVTPYPALEGQLLKLDAALFKGLGKVVLVRGKGKFFQLHATFVTGEFITKTGSFVVQKA